MSPAIIFFFLNYSFGISGRAKEMRANQGCGRDAGTLE
jgi:hypothetical protein